jgi:DNA-directed RNA polymerase subunit RPC12/RpoP
VGNRFAAGKHAISECDRCGQRFKLKLLKTEIIKTKKYDLLVCPECWDPDHPQLQLGMWPVDDPQALRNPRPDRSYVISGLLADGELGGGSRIFQWGWNPVGGSSGTDAYLTPNVLAMVVQIGTVTIATT